MTLDDFRKNFPSDSEVPVPLVKLLLYQNQSADWYSGYFELSAHGRDDTLTWFDGDKEAAYQFVPFGVGPDDSSYCFWVYGGKRVEEAPIAFIGSEGIGNTVLASSVEDFLALLAVGYEELGFADWSRGAGEETERLQGFRSWLKREFDIVAPKRGLEIIEKAKTQHPDLEEWFRSWQEVHFKAV